MCGFITIYNSQSCPNVTRNEMDSMCDLIERRGPDHYGFYQDDNLITGCRRLSILDLSDDANIPLTKGNSTISYNGEVYNYLEIKEKLIKERNVFFKTKSDTEVVLEAYLAYGSKCLNMFNGMFAFAIWDKLNKKLFIARDRIGEKPLYYSLEKNGSYYFSGGWHIKGTYSLFLGFVFSASTIWNPNLMFLQSYAWIIGALISSITYYLLAKK